MTRIWSAIAAAAAFVLILGVVAVHAVSGPDLGSRQHPMTDDWANGSDAWSSRQADEYGYLTQMVAHHQEAIAAAEQLSRSDRPRMREFGAAIVSTQSAQVAQMNTWLAAWYPDRAASPSSYQPEMRDLTKLSDGQLDRAFLTDMIGHHMIAVMQSQHLLVSGLVEHAEVGDLATTIRNEQRAEIHQMVRWLRHWYPGQRSSTAGMPMPGPMRHGSMGSWGSGPGLR